MTNLTSGRGSCTFTLTHARAHFESCQVQQGHLYMSVWSQQADGNVPHVLMEFLWSFLQGTCTRGVCGWELCFLLRSSLACWSETLHHFWSAPTSALGRFLPSGFSSLISVSNGDPGGSVCPSAGAQALQQCPRSALPPKCCSSCSAWATVNYFLPNSASNR